MTWYFGNNELKARHVLCLFYCSPELQMYMDHLSLCFVANWLAIEVVYSQVGIEVRILLCLR